MRKFRQIFSPIGLFIVILGPDGSGKSTVSGLIAKQLERSFRKTWRFHWRPKLLPKLGRNGKADGAQQRQYEVPPEQSKYRGIVSLLRFLYYWLDFVLGYWLVIYPLKTKTTLILGERYFTDVIVNPERYGFAVPHWLMRLFSKLVHSPDVLVLLKDDPEVIYARKPELSVERIASQIAAYEKELTYWKEATVVVTKGGAEAVATKISKIILDKCSQSDLLHRDYANIGYHNSNYRVFPLWGRGRILIYRNDKVKRGLIFYHPTSLAGRLLKINALLLGDFGRYLLFRKAKVEDYSHFPLNQTEKVIAEILNRKNLGISFFLGNPGPRRKVTAQVSSGGKVIAYVKIGTGSEVTHLLRREADMLDLLADHSTTTWKIPKLIRLFERENWIYLFTTPPNQVVKNYSFELTDAHEQFARSIFQKTAKIFQIKEYDQEKKIKERLSRIPDLNEIQESTAIANLVWARVRENLAQTGILTGVCHGDFAPWNILKLQNDSFLVFDWEYGSMEGPALSDLCHFLRMPRHLIWKWPASRTIGAILDWDSYNGLLLARYVKALGISINHVGDYILLYLLQEYLRHAGTGGGSAEALQAYPSQAVQMNYLSNCMKSVLDKSY